MRDRTSSERRGVEPTGERAQPEGDYAFLGAMFRPRVKKIDQNLLACAAGDHQWSTMCGGVDHCLYCRAERTSP